MGIFRKGEKAKSSNKILSYDEWLKVAEDIAGEPFKYKPLNSLDFYDYEEVEFDPVNATGTIAREIDKRVQSFKKDKGPVEVGAFVIGDGKENMYNKIVFPKYMIGAPTKTREHFPKPMINYTYPYVMLQKNSSNEPGLWFDALGTDLHGKRFNSQFIPLSEIDTNRPIEEYFIAFLEREGKSTKNIKIPELLNTYERVPMRMDLLGLRRAVGWSPGFTFNTLNKNRVKEAEGREEEINLFGEVHIHVDSTEEAWTLPGSLEEFIDLKFEGGRQNYIFLLSPGDATRFRVMFNYLNGIAERSKIEPPNATISFAGIFSYDLNFNQQGGGFFDYINIADKGEVDTYKTKTERARTLQDQKEWSEEDFLSYLAFVNYVSKYTGSEMPAYDFDD